MATDRLWLAAVDGGVQAGKAPVTWCEFVGQVRELADIQSPEDGYSFVKWWKHS